MRKIIGREKQILQLNGLLISDKSDLVEWLHVREYLSKTRETVAARVRNKWNKLQLLKLEK